MGSHSIAMTVTCLSSWTIRPLVLNCHLTRFLRILEISSFFISFFSKFLTLPGQSLFILHNQLLQQVFWRSPCVVIETAFVPSFTVHRALLFSLTIDEYIVDILYPQSWTFSAVGELLPFRPTNIIFLYAVDNRLSFFIINYTFYHIERYSNLCFFGAVPRCTAGHSYQFWKFIFWLASWAACANVSSSSATVL